VGPQGSRAQFPTFTRRFHSAMDLSYLQRNITDLETSLRSLEHWLAFMTGLVVLGLVIEYWLEFPEAIRELRDAWSWKPLCVVLGGIFITVGVAGEFVVQYFASAKESSLRIANDAISSDLRSKASEAIERAAKLEKDAAQLKKDAEQERLERVKLEAIVAPRSLSLSQQQAIADTCEGGHNIVVSSYGTDGEAAALGAQLIGVLRSAHNSVADARGSIVTSGEFDSGIHLRGPEIERIFISCIGNALSSAGKLKVLMNDPRPKMGAAISGGGQGFRAGVAFVDLMVGVKPLPVLAAR
jgi:hypothetical protein